MRATGAALSLSVSVKRRPRTSAIRIVSKYPGLALKLSAVAVPPASGARPSIAKALVGRWPESGRALTPPARVTPGIRSRPRILRWRSARGVLEVRAGFREGRLRGHQRGRHDVLRISRGSRSEAAEAAAEAPIRRTSARANSPMTRRLRRRLRSRPTEAPRAAPSVSASPAGEWSAAPIRRGSRDGGAGERTRERAGPRGSPRRGGPAGARRRSRSTPHTAISPSPPPMSDRKTDSVSICRTGRPRSAPRAAHPISRWREVERECGGWRRWRTRWAARSRPRRAPSSAGRDLATRSSRAGEAGPQAAAAG
jgi:hypothetical protein